MYFCIALLKKTSCKADVILKIHVFYPMPANKYYDFLTKDCLVVILSFETRKNLGTITFSVCSSLSLLPLLLELYKFYGKTSMEVLVTVKLRLTTHGRHLVTASFKLILVETLSLQQGAANSGEGQIILRTSKIKKTETIILLLVLGRDAYLDCCVSSGI